MTGLTVTEMAEKLKLPRNTVMRRIQRGGYKPITKDAIYSEDVLEAIRDIAMGRRKKAPDEKPSKPKKR
jgi:plasmid maintenance system antidote protein VapI